MGIYLTPVTTTCSVLAVEDYPRNLLELETRFWTLLHKLRHAMVRPGRDRLQGHVEVDEAFVDGEEEGVHGRQTETKAMIAVAAEADGPGIGGFACGALQTLRRRT